MEIGMFDPKVSRFQKLNQQQVSLEEKLKQARTETDIKKIQFDLSATKRGIFRLLERELGVY